MYIVSKILKDSHLLKVKIMIIDLYIIYIFNIIKDMIIFNICIYIICKKLTLLTLKEFVKFASSLSNVQF